MSGPTPRPPSPASSHAEQFANVFESFLAEQSRGLSDLRAAATASPPDDASLRHLISRVVSRYESKAASARRDVGPMFSPSWTSTTENFFMWTGGWRPSAAFHLLHSKSGIQLEARLAEIIHQGAVNDLGNISPAQLQAVNRLQRETVRAERAISEAAAEAQEAVAATEMVHLVESEEQDQMESKMAERKEGMRSVLASADRLRIATIKRIVDILGLIQAVHFLIAAAELHLAVHQFGMEKDQAAAAREV